MAYRPTFHLTPPEGWMNDPNGFCYFEGSYHLFYQHNPESPKWGRMYWGHAVSSDLIRWEHRPVALRPDTPWERLSGCFSGSSVVQKEGLHLFYTGVSRRGQYQLHAFSPDAWRFTKYAEPFIGPGALPPGGQARNFRDPKVFYRDGKFYCLIGGRFRRGLSRGAQLSLYRSDDLQNWRFMRNIMRDNVTSRGMFECPDYATVDGQDILFVSPSFLSQNINHEFENLHSVAYLPVEWDGADGIMVSGNPGEREYHELDGGTDFFASQTATAPDGRVILVAWMQMWNRSMPTESEGWAGCMTFPRELSFSRGRLLQWPIRELERYRLNSLCVENRPVFRQLSLPGFQGRCVDLEFIMDIRGSSEAGVRLLCSSDGSHYIQIGYTRGDKLLSVDRSSSTTPVRSTSRLEKQCQVRSGIYEAADHILHLRILIDRTTVEVFTGDKRLAMSTLVYNNEEDRGIEFFSETESGLLWAEIHQIEVGSL